MNSDPTHVHIAGVVVHARPSRLADVAARVGAMPGAEVHGQGAGGKLAVTLEDARSDGILERLHALQRIPGVLSAVLVFEHADTLDSMNEPV